MEYLAEMYDNGEGVQQNPEEAVRLYKMAASWSSDAKAALRKKRVDSIFGFFKK
ncbi:MAG: SEL1-like repeat protein [Oscillospiraceae bacterium]|nr:SEL1-like repeat protein [Oscillospiraceae bacterium]